MRERERYQEAKIETINDADEDGNGGEFGVAEVADECLSDAIVRVSRESTDYGRTDYAPQQRRLHQNPTAKTRFFITTPDQ